MLLEKKATIPENAILNKALSLAIQRGNVNIIPFLIENNAKATGEMLLEAVKKNHQNIVELLLPHLSQANVEIEDKQGDTALIIAAKNGNTEIVTLLMEKKPQKKNTALMAAASQNHQNIIQQLLTHFSVKEKKEICIDLARIGYQHPSVMDLLIEEKKTIEKSTLNDALHERMIYQASQRHYGTVYSIYQELVKNDFVFSSSQDEKKSTLDLT